MHALHPHDMGCRTSIPTSSSIHGLLAARAYAARLSRNLLAKSAADAAEMPQLPGSARVTCKLHAHNALVAAMRHGMQRACQQNALASRGDSVNVITKSSCCGCCAGYAISCLHAVKVPDNHVSGGGLTEVHCGKVDGRAFQVACEIQAFRAIIQPCAGSGA